MRRFRRRSSRIQPVPPDDYNGDDTDSDTNAEDVNTSLSSGTDPEDGSSTGIETAKAFRDNRDLGIRQRKERSASQASKSVSAMVSDGTPQHQEASQRVELPPSNSSPHLLSPPISSPHTPSDSLQQRHVRADTGLQSNNQGVGNDKGPHTSDDNASVIHNTTAKRGSLDMVRLPTLQRSRAIEKHQDHHQRHHLHPMRQLTTAQRFGRNAPLQRIPSETTTDNDADDDDDDDNEDNEENDNDDSDPGSEIPHDGPDHAQGANEGGRADQNYESSDSDVNATKETSVTQEARYYRRPRQLHPPLRSSPLRPKATLADGEPKGLNNVSANAQVQQLKASTLPTSPNRSVFNKVTRSSSESEAKSKMTAASSLEVPLYKDKNDHQFESGQQSPSEDHCESAYSQNEDADDTSQTGNPAGHNSSSDEERRGDDEGVDDESHSKANLQSSLHASANRGWRCSNTRLHKMSDESNSVSNPAQRNFMHPAGAPVHIALACCFIDDAMHGRLANGKNKLYFATSTVQRVFLIHTSNPWLYFVYLVAILLAAMTFFEPPSTAEYASWTLGVEFFCILVYMLDIGMKMVYMGILAYWKKNWHKMQVVFVTLYLLDAIIFAMSPRTVRFSRFFRPAILLGRHRELRHTFYVVSAMVPRLIKVFAMMVAFIGFFAVVGVHAFADDYNNVPDTYPQLERTFDNVPRAFLRMFVLFSTENYPYVVLPSYQDNPASFLYFFVFVYAGVFFLTAMLLGLVVSTYFDFTAKQIHSERKKEWRGLLRAFSLLDTEGTGYVSMNAWYELIKYLRPEVDRRQAKFFFELLDRDSKSKLDCFDFLDLREVMLLKIRPTPPTDFSATQRNEWAWLRASAFSLLESRWFRPFIMTCLGLNAVLACVYFEDIPKDTHIVLQSFHVVFALIFVFELCVQIVAQQWYSFVSSRWNITDLFIISAAFILQCCAIYKSMSSGHLLNLIANGLLLVRLLWVSKDAKFGLVLIWNIIGAVLHLSYFMAVILYFYGVLGIEVFHSYTPADLTSAAYYDYHCNMGFETMGCACFTLFQVMTGSNWQDPMNDLVVVAGWGSAVYFVSFVLVINLTLMDILVAVTIEAFLLAKRNFQGVSADEIHAAFVEIPVDEEDVVHCNLPPDHSHDAAKHAVSDEKSPSARRRETDTLLTRATLHSNRASPLLMMPRNLSGGLSPQDHVLRAPTKLPPLRRMSTSSIHSGLAIFDLATHETGALNDQLSNMRADLPLISETFVDDDNVTTRVEIIRVPTPTHLQPPSRRTSAGELLPFDRGSRVTITPSPISMSASATIRNTALSRRRTLRDRLRSIVAPRFPG
eukprot:m.103027 g.103027  ORF g.103027 m.103027 type:complete len:1325 (+) comp15028_c1_seq7:250-4224(+)